jgi:hypothetical protein
MDNFLSSECSVYCCAVPYFKASAPSVSASQAVKYSELAAETACATETGAVPSEAGQTVSSAESARG